MNQDQRIKILSEIIRNELSEHIDSDYYLLEVPYYTNVGDTLIWQGEMDFLKGLHHKCKGMYSLDTFPFPKISPTDIILFQGGGNFGDLWKKHHEFKLKLVERYPENKFVFFPQTVFFQDKEELKRSASILGSNKNIVICARDKESFDILRNNFSAQILLVPDMAFCIDIKKHLLPYEAPSKSTDLLVKRVDKELMQNDVLTGLENGTGIEISDWPTFDKPISFPTRVLEKLKTYLPRSRFIVDFFAQEYYRRYLLKTGVRFISRHNIIYSTRLHAAILGMLLGKDVHMIDNSYGKNSQFYNTWLRDTEGVELF